ncbi:MAG: class I SAM-dependent methyltransferase [Nitrospirota bacterium]
MSDTSLPIAPAPPVTDWNALAATFDRWVPHLQPLGDHLINLLEMEAGLRVLDVACGTGEPSLSIARRFGPSVTVTGVDNAEAMIARARAKAASEALPSATYRVMPAERLDVPDAAFDRVVCRFGLMLFDDPVAGAREMWRALAPGGRVAIAVWGPLPLLASVHTLWRLLPDYLPPEHVPPTPKMTSLGAPGALQHVLAAAGWAEPRVRPYRVIYRFATPREYWDLAVESGVFKDLLAKLSCHAQVAFKARALADIAAFTRGDAVELPNDALVAVADKPAN